MSGRGDLRDWQPGDGLTCRFAKTAPQGIPCGPPVKTRVFEMTQVRRLPRTLIQPVCANHIAETPPSAIRAAAEKAAREQIITAHWDEYQAAITEEIARRTA